MKYVLHKAASRGHFDHGWLKTWHTFSFADYFDRSRMNFGVLRVLNDDSVAAESGFGMHPHQNMEILTVMLEGELSHRDSFGHAATIGTEEVQVMSAGTGIYHSEFNNSKTNGCKLLQLWFLPEEQNIKPRYEQHPVDPQLRKDNIHTFVAPFGEDTSLSLHQDVWVSRLDSSGGKSYTYRMHRDNTGLYVFVIDGSIRTGGQLLERRDGIGLYELREAEIEVPERAEIILFEVKMN